MNKRSISVDIANLGENHSRCFLPCERIIHAIPSLPEELRDAALQAIEASHDLIVLMNGIHIPDDNNIREVIRESKFHIRNRYTHVFISVFGRYFDYVPTSSTMRHYLYDILYKCYGYKREILKEVYYYCSDKLEGLGYSLSIDEFKERYTSLDIDSYHRRENYAGNYNFTALIQELNEYLSVIDIFYANRSLLSVVTISELIAYKHREEILLNSNNYKGLLKKMYDIFFDSNGVYRELYKERLKQEAKLIKLIPNTTKRREYEYYLKANKNHSKLELTLYQIDQQEEYLKSCKKVLSITNKLNKIIPDNSNRILYESYLRQVLEHENKCIVVEGLDRFKDHIIGQVSNSKAIEEREKLIQEIQSDRVKGIYSSTHANDICSHSSDMFKQKIAKFRSNIEEIKQVDNLDENTKNRLKNSVAEKVRRITPAVVLWM